jgi:hypothetical protein
MFGRREVVGRGVAGHVIERFLLRYVLGRAPDHGGKLHLPVDLIGDAGNLHRGAGVGKRPCRLEEMPRLEALAMRVRLRRPVHAASHFSGVVGIIGAGAVNRRRPAHRRQQLGASKRQRFDAAFSGGGRRFAQDDLRRLPVLEDAEHGRIGALAREPGGIEHLVVDDQAGARAIGGLVGRELVAGHVRLLPCVRCCSRKLSPNIAVLSSV